MIAARLPGISMPGSAGSAGQPDLRPGGAAALVLDTGRVEPYSGSTGGRLPTRGYDFGREIGYGQRSCARFKIVQPQLKILVPHQSALASVR